MSAKNWQPSVGELVVCYSSRDYGITGTVLSICGRMATVRLVTGKTVERHFCDLSPR